MKQTQQTGNNNSQPSSQLAATTIGKSLGKGTFGKVKLATHLLTGEKVAVKILEKDKIKDRKDVERITREIKILKKIIETEQELYLIMEYCPNGELFDYIVQQQRLSEKQACKFYQELLSGIEYIHLSGICHRDLKPENLLIDFDKSLKIVDFGLSNMYEDGETLKTACGSPCYAAPEMIAGKRYQGLKTDIWSSGVVLFAMVCGFLPFEDPKTSNLYKKILNAEYQIPKFVSAECQDIITKILNTNPDTRFTLEEIRNHPWMRQVRDKRPLGLIPGKEKMPINETIFRQILAEHKFDPEYSMKCIEANRHNQITATYHLLYKKALRTNKPLAENLNATGSIDRNTNKVGTRGKQDLLDMTNGRRAVGQSNNYRPVDLNQTLPSTFYPGALQSVNGGEETTNLNSPEITAQKKYKLQLQAEINKLKSKYQVMHKPQTGTTQPPTDHTLILTQFINLNSIENSQTHSHQNRVTPKNVNAADISSPSPDQIAFVQDLQQQHSQASKNTQNSTYSHGPNAKFYQTGMNFNKSKLPSATTTESTNQSIQSKQSMGQNSTYHQRYKTQIPDNYDSNQARQKFASVQQQNKQTAVGILAQSINSSQNKQSPWKGQADLNNSINHQGNKPIGQMMLSGHTPLINGAAIHIQKFNTDTQITQNSTGKSSISNNLTKNIITIDDTLGINNAKKQIFNTTLQTFAQILPDKYTGQAPQKRGKTSSIDHTSEQRKHNAQTLNMSTIIPSSKIQFNNQATVDYSYPIPKAQQISQINNQSRIGTAKMNDLRLQTALDFSTIKVPNTSNTTGQSKNTQGVLNTTIEFASRQANTGVKKGSLRYSAAGANRTSGSPIQNDKDQTSASLNISELYKHYSKKQNGNNAAQNGASHSLQLKATNKGHGRAISVLDGSSAQTQPINSTTFTKRHESHSQNKKALISIYQ